MTEIINPHDHFFKVLFSSKQNAIDFVQHYLPAEVVQCLTLPTLEISKDSFIDATLSEHYSDLLYQVDLQNGQPSYIYLLFDHKSYVDPLVGLQLLGYMVRIWDLWLSQEKEKRKRQREQQELIPKLQLPPIMPIVLYHGEENWRVAPQFTALFELPPELGRYVPSFEYWLCDLSKYSDEELKGAVISVILRTGLLTLKYALRPGLQERLADIFGLLRELTDKRTGLEYLEALLRYVSVKKEVTIEELERVVKEVFSKEEDIMADIAQKWIVIGLNEGLAKGRAEGHAEGRVEGCVEGRVEGLTKGLAKGRTEGLTKGLAKGRTESMVKAIGQTMAIRFKVDRKRYLNLLKRLPLARLEQLNKVALKAETPAEFEAKLKKMLPHETITTNL